MTTPQTTPKTAPITFVNDHPSLTHEAIADAISNGTAEQLRKQARECRTVEANVLAQDLERFADDRDEFGTASHWRTIYGCVADRPSTAVSPTGAR